MSAETATPDDAAPPEERAPRGRRARKPKPDTPLRDLLALAKPSITMLVLITSAGGLWLAPGELGWASLFATLAGTVLVVAAANMLNCYLERDSDRFMARTKNRPLPAGRMNPNRVLALGLTLAFISIPLLYLAVNPVTGLLAALALVSYVWVYTPMKQHSPAALLVGAIPGAMPPLMGWTAVTGRIEWPGVILFAIMFIWQVPHFIAISMYRRREYERAGIVTLPTKRGQATARWHMIGWAAVLLPVSLMLVPLDVAGWIYAGTASALGLIFLWYAVDGLRAVNQGKWARKVFLFSLIYVTVLFAALLVDAGPYRLT